MSKVAERFVKEFVVLFGFLNGIWIAIGVNPEAEVFKAFRLAVEALNPTPGLSILFTLVPVLITIATLFGAYSLGKWISIGAVLCGFIGGLLILINPIIAILFLFAGFGLGTLVVDG
ncbi:hypothetical protein COT48_01665 [Candidatus Woesearchaeota archaeon CG08_land_8_20_14_0_20_47_9]|nr:MAG: hypothetical protein COV22_04005 [Candidatus Woesearchaeota archaeon CG10_big_fil_rev_8_21_14_0_10_47_5]PIO04198.1 MAG: hypothetical protein COT48_01665 [Candidatus Woesearchaeota archaeon CG08_land_8_20_14_0_20_47_9]